jgi:tetratricopeptide (TPR) repeat protein
LWFFACIVIEGTIVPLELVFEHRMYLPSIGIIGFVVLQAAPHLKRSWHGIAVGYIAVAVVITFLCWNTSRLVEVWRSNITLYEHAIKVSPRSARAHNNLGKAYWESNDSSAAIQHYELAVELDPSFQIALHNLARAYQTTKQTEKATQIYIRLLEYSPANSDYNFSVGLYYLEFGQHQQAANYFRQALHY